MFGFFAAGSFLLQVPAYFKADNPFAAMLLAIVITLLAAVVIIIHILRYRDAVSAVGKKIGPVGPKRFSGFTMRRIASDYGLDKAHAKFLEFVFRNDSVSDPERVMNTPELLDKHFKHAYITIEKSEEAEDLVQRQLERLFSLRNIIESSPVNDPPLDPEKLPETEAVLTAEKGSYDVKIISAKEDGMIVEAPRNTLGTPLKINRGTKATLLIFKSSKGYSFDCRTLGAVSTAHGPGIQLIHGGKPRLLAQRRHRRITAEAPCDFFYVNTETIKKGRKKSVKLVIEPKRFTGTVLDISAGGCSIKASGQVQVGSRLKIDIDYLGRPAISVLGQVLRSNRSGLRGTIIHLKFLKIPRKAFNNINSLVFGYDDN